MTPEQERYLSLLESALKKNLNRSPRRYVFNFLFEDTAEEGDDFNFQPQTQSVIVGKNFFVGGLEANIRIVGSSETGGGFLFNLVPFNTVDNQIFDLFEATVKIKDISEWTSGPINNNRLSSGPGIPLNLIKPDCFQPFLLPSYYQIFSGTEVFVTLSNILAKRVTTIFEEETIIASYQVEVAMVGFEQ